MPFERYAVFVTPQGPLANAGAAWLGWDLVSGSAVTHPDVGLNLNRITETPRMYGFHGTIKPPFVLADGKDAAQLGAAFAALCARLAPVTLERLEVANLGPFLALKPLGDQGALAALAGEVVKQLDPFRAPPSQAELARRRKARLTPAQERNLMDWGYPYVMDDFRFHMTLTGRVKRSDDDAVSEVARGYFAPHLPAPLVVDTLTLVGQDADGMFREIRRCDLKG